MALEQRVSPGEVTIRHETQLMTLRPSFAQRHNLSNLLAAIAAARALGVTPGGDLEVRFSALRGERIALPGGIVLVNDCYNANPMSMRAAIEDLAETAPARRVAVLGDMLELGSELGPGLHREVAEHATERGVDVLIAVGPLAAAMADAFVGEAHSVPDAQAAWSAWRRCCRPTGPTARYRPASRPASGTSRPRVSASGGAGGAPIIRREGAEWAAF